MPLERKFESGLGIHLKITHIIQFTAVISITVHF